MNKLIATYPILTVAFLLTSCYGVNEKTSEICHLNHSCPSNTWDNIISQYSTDSIKDTNLIDKLPGFEKQSFPNDVIYFQ